jgi:alkanesulfonate monooxygenase SsuD/methylene tetrahydromethanopterin reductase-like flavin-dependent oxidoreductase (luciferase family)
MRIGIHLPQFGRAIAAQGVQRAARAAEESGFDDLWVSDHLVNPKEQAYPAPYILDPLQTLAFAAAVTERVGVGTSVLVGPQYTSPWRWPTRWCGPHGRDYLHLGDFQPG